ncbi:PFL_4669 family integrating conjugative element protein [Achromobacter xylosoxidans]
MAPKKTAVDSSLSAFATADTSPFPDRYDLDGERRILGPLLDEDDPDPSNPFFGRLQLFYEREAEFKRMRQSHEARAGADPLVGNSEARQIRTLPSLVAESQDVMSLHTLEALRLFMGKAVEPGKQGAPIAGGKRVAAALRSLWSLSSNDNPYADWALVETKTRIEEVRAYIKAEQAQLLQKLDEMKSKGLTYSVLQSREPAQMQLGFASPYGYMVALLIVEVDYFTRVLKSAQRRDLVSGRQGHALLQSVKHKCRSVFERVLYWQKYLMKDELVALSRVDFVAGADVVAQQRVQAVKTIFGDVPKAVFMGDEAPRHTKRRLNLSAAELRLLDAVPLTDEVTAGVDKNLLA